MARTARPLINAPEMATIRVLSKWKSCKMFRTSVVLQNYNVAHKIPIKLSQNEGKFLIKIHTK